MGPDNENYFIRSLNSSHAIIAAWGENGKIHQRYKKVEEFCKVISYIELDR
ncbi:DUF1643 domain-containing protein [Priestia flexa]|uniref:DUF1643 domain-containing protein n=1 Tax=Priestia flexa TaxID=86664 RepID=UPI00399D2F8B